MSEAPSSSRQCRRWLLLILAVSLSLRVYLAFHGGQDFWPDEARYQASQYAAEALWHGHWRTAAVNLLGRADHSLFGWFGLPPAFYGLLVGPSPAAVASYFSLFSTLVIYLLWRVARRAGAGEREALLAAFLAACANSLFYYSRHFFPYDIALVLMLLALHAALGPWSPGRSYRTGVLAGIGFLTYNGYWLLGGEVLILHALLGGGNVRRFAARALLAGLGLATPLTLFLVLARAAGYDLLAAVQLNAATVTQGDFHLGYRVIPAYLWHAEHGLSLLWLGGSAATLAWWARERRPLRMAWWLGGLVLVAFGLVLFSDVLAKFVVYGRLVRQLVPFFCLTTAFAAERFAERAFISRRTLGWGVVAVGALAAWNIAGPLRQVFPDGFRRLAQAEVFRQQRGGSGVYRVVNDENLWGKDLRVALPPHEVVLRRRNPHQFRPYQYEGFTAAQRADLNRQDVSMRLLRLTGEPGGAGDLKLAPDAGLWGNYPGPIRLRLRFALDQTRLGQPLVTAGTDRRADFLFVVTEPPARVRFGFDHWNGGTLLSDPIEVDFAQPHDLVISMGALLPPEGEVLSHQAKQAGLRNELLLVLDGKVVWSQWFASYAVAPETITMGANFVGGNLTVPSFAGQILRLERVALDEVGPHVAALAGRYLAAHRPDGWQGAMGPVRFRCRLPDVAPGAAQPLLAAGEPGDGDLIFWIREPGGRLRFGFDRWGEGAVFSEPVTVDAGQVHEVVMSLGSLMPPEGNSIYDTEPNLQRLRDRLLVSLDGRLVFSLQRTFARPADNVVFGANGVGSSVASAYFTGNMLAIEPVDPAEVLAASIQLASHIKRRPPVWQGFPGPVRLTLCFPATAPPLPEPLIVTGQTGRGDFIYVRYEGKDRIRVGFDHWGVNGGESPSVVIDPEKEHELTIGFGALMPPKDSPLYRQEPELLRLRTLLWVSLDGRTVFVTPMAAHPTQPAQIMLGTNFIGGSTTTANFTGQIIAAEGVAPEELLAQLNAASSAPPDSTR